MSLIVKDSRNYNTALSFRGRKINQIKTSAAVLGWNGPNNIRDSRIEGICVYGFLQLKRINLISELYTSAVAGVTTHGRGQKTDSTKTVSTNAFIAVVVVLAVFVAVCIVLLLILIRKHRKEVSSGFDSEEFPHCSPLSDDNSGSIQTYGEIVSVSVSNASTEGTDIITSGLECFRFRLTGQTTPVQRKSSQSKQVIFDFCENSNGYITREIGGEIRHCVPISNCPPGHEIVPCIEKFTNDTCQRCSEGFVQPDYIQSTKDPSLTECFENQNVDKCQKYDVEPSREKGASGCGSGGEFCKCDTDKCLFGDPCLCQYRKCGMDETMLTDGNGIAIGRANTPDSTENASSNAYIPAVVVLSVLVVVCIVVVFLVLLRKRKRNTNQDVIEQGKFLVSANGNNTMKNDNDVNGNQDEAGGNIENEVNKDNVNDQSITSINDSRRDVFCSDNELSNNGKAIEVRNVEELPIVITGIVESKKDMSFPVEHSDVDRIDITVGEQLIAENTEADYMEKHTQMSLLRAPRLDKDSLNTNSTTGNAQLTEHSLKPVRQVSHESLDQNRDEVSSGYGSEEFPRSPMSYDKGPGSLQTYGDLVSVSVSNGSTEGTEVITSGLESFNYKLTGQTSPVHRESIQPKQIIVRNESGVFDNGNG
ncbi:unnamed protein product [Mytilus edulis]|uniref:Uncharacterized protein n=1 Tax=Mytilus edulis TaxID=6550 RepID=A0A8S3TX99_MYTED|nr:unnamed protein product [Mytilus edulis]